jgi:hypothetical protein
MNSAKTEKPCTKCHKTKKLSCFHNHNKSPDGHKNVCKECKKAEDKARNLAKKVIVVETEESKMNRIIESLTTAISERDVDSEERLGRELQIYLANRVVERKTNNVNSIELRKNGLIHNTAIAEKARVATANPTPDTISNSIKAFYNIIKSNIVGALNMCNIQGIPVSIEMAEYEDHYLIWMEGMIMTEAQRTALSHNIRM